MSIPLWTAADAAAATGGRATTDWQAGGVSIDTRALAPGDLFVALKDVRDGHDFVADALAAGAAAALVSRIPEGLDESAPLLVVDDVLPALEALGRAGRARARAQVIGVTGSVGKTSAKEMLRAVLGGQGQVHAAEKSFNNHWGVPLTLARLPQDADFAVIEIGMNHPGEIAPLSIMARPHVALITTVAAAHLEAFASVAEIAREKAAIFEGLEPGGVAVVNADLDETPILARAAEARPAAGPVIAFGQADGAQYRLIDLVTAPDHTVCRALTPEGELLYKVNSPGRHFAMNALGVMAAATSVGADPGIASGDLGRWQPPAGRGTRERLVLDRVESAQTLDLIDDAFNANPASLGAALDVLAASAPQDGLGRVRAGRRLAILGDMLELGPQEVELHRAVARHPAMARLDRVHCVGPRMRELWQDLPGELRGEWCETAEEMAERARGLIDAGDVVLVKGSKGSRVSLVVDAIRKLGQALPSETEG
ncbi:UDP-N-acetylmuramoyl-tripeptide--D-alanyl-D-alanine ligase [Brevirhabdus pacifica]|uniref:UDP-N-acetylmuramoyl-tripeptide--D-alanyl-D-alanine ligase n=1 Tax=Brevirhabdus pacifica TaxID=1267768 RepID=A0A1U7DKQ8_9RHOB|nr:UDP-N-acetylmuramoyl-tripeptide--D-alanyl-D-alanine ligase [Brevirhabdus pacifica]APX90552.1 UDP-N-acetylmuramoyl-tripeptide--D-alanyl-D-alanine ligase [Brevirhabdus pacifica]OWU78447.1 UDP-N-acetylmuramoyl-tripeptide--D-alanyl-D-alanine ligase [Loktanella sp. 22II-4b]PJJ85320.1 UDP-N-acetylmuramoyl-tripeptide--D-alanyl-D-alanine ligase [Brevirhabdus pacifica]